MRRGCILNIANASVVWVHFSGVFMLKKNTVMWETKLKCSGSNGVSFQGTILIQGAWDLCDLFLLVQDFPAYRSPSQWKLKIRNVDFLHEKECSNGLMNRHSDYKALLSHWNCRLLAVTWHWTGFLLVLAHSDLSVVGHQKRLNYFNFTFSQRPEAIGFYFEINYPIYLVCINTHMNNARSC